MKMRVATLFAVIAGLFVVGCIDSNERLTMAKDGSGVYRFEIDVDYAMYGALLDEETRDSMGLDQDFDSTKAFVELFEEGQLSREQAAWLDGAVIRTANNTSTQKMTIAGELPFKDLAQFTGQLALLEEIGLDAALQAPKQSYTLQKGKLISALRPIPAEAEPDESTMSMLQMAFSDRTSTLTYELGSQVKKASGPNTRIISRNELRTTQSMVDVMSWNLNQGVVIKFK